VSCPIKTTCINTLITLFLLGLLSHAVLAQPEIQRKIDSLYRIFPTVEDDSSKIRVNNFLSYYYENLDIPSNIDSSIATIERALVLMRKPENKEIFNYGFFQAAHLYSKINDYEKSLNTLIEYLELSQSINNYNWEGHALVKLCSLFSNLKDEENAQKYAQMLEAVYPKMDKESRKYDVMNQLGTYYKNIGENELALSKHFQAMDIALSQKNKKTTSFSYNNIGLVYKNLKEYDKALEYYVKSLKIKEELNNTKGIAGSYINIASVYNLQKDHEKAIQFALTGLEYADEAKASLFKLSGLENLFQSYVELKKYKEATEIAIQLLKLKDEIYNANITEQTQKLEKQYETEKKKQELVLLKKDAELKAIEIDQQQNSIKNQQRLILFFTIGFFIFVVLLFFLFRTVRQKQKANTLLSENVEVINEQKSKVEMQKQVVEEKNNEILASIKYAKRIQTAILPQKKLIDSYFSDYFIFYKPKDIVAGDFYWFEKVNNTYYVAAADCTGHGVPGAMVSVVCNNGLNKSLKEHNLRQPKEILDKTREVVISQFEKSDENVQDGMDISLISIKEEPQDKFRISFSGANNSLWVLRKFAAEIEEVKGDKQPIGKYRNMQAFEQHDLQLNQGDLIFLFTDGFVDQFGGLTSEARANGGKKYKSSRLKDTLIKLRNESCADQAQNLEKEFSVWKGELDQIDDVCVIGIRL
jgi:serine phosphatase RsbU (regulator of sigma subunit)